MRILLSEFVTGRSVAMRVLPGCASSLARTRDEDEEFDRYVQVLHDDPKADVELSWPDEDDILDALQRAGHVLRVAPRSRLGMPAILQITDAWIARARTWPQEKCLAALTRAGQVMRIRDSLRASRERM